VAEENKPDENETSGSKSNKKLIIIIVLGTLLAIGLSVGVTLFLLMGDDKPDEELDGATPIEEVKIPASYLDVTPPFLVTFNVDGRQRYMQISFSVSSRDAAVFTSIEYHMPLIRSKLISTYGGMDFNLIKTDPGKVELQKKTVEIINAVLSSEGEGQIENIYFTNFVLQ
jgi:flagellar FliL protein